MQVCGKEISDLLFLGLPHLCCIGRFHISLLLCVPSARYRSSKQGAEVRYFVGHTKWQIYHPHGAYFQLQITEEAKLNTFYYGTGDIGVDHYLHLHHLWFLVLPRQVRAGRYPHLRVHAHVLRQRRELRVFLSPYPCTYSGVLTPASAMTYSLRSGGGVGDLLKPPTWGDPETPYRILYDSTFFFVVIVILLNIIFGIIIDTFGGAYLYLLLLGFRS